MEITIMVKTPKNGEYGVIFRVSGVEIYLPAANYEDANEVAYLLRKGQDARSK